MDLKKEIKLSDLVRRPQKQTRAGAKPSGGAPRKRGRKQEIVGLKIGASQIAASRVVNNGGRAELVQLARIPLEPGVVVAGEVRDLPALASALAELFRTHKLPRRGVRLGIATNRIGVRSFELEGIEDERQLANAIRFRAYEELSIPANEAVLDYHVVSEGVNEAGQRSRRVVLAAAYRDSIDRYVAACKEAGIEVAAVDLEAFALLRAVAPAAERDEQAAVVAVTIGHDRTTLAISDGVVCDFTRVLEWGGANLEDAIARELGLSTDEARQLMLALDLGDDASDGDDPSLARARAVLARELQTLARELIASLRFYQSQPGSLAISTVLITGGTTKLRGLAEELERLTRVRVRRADPLAGVQTADAVGTRDDLASLAVAIGLGIEAEMRGVNLLPAPRVEKRPATAQTGLRSKNGIAATAGAVLVLVAALLALGFVQGRSDVSDRRATLEGLEAQVAQKQAAASVSAAVAAQAQAHLAAFTAASSGRSNWDGLLDQLARVMPQGVWLNTMQLTPGATSATATTGNATSAVVTTNGLTPSGGASAPTGTTFTVTGNALSRDAVARVLDRLALIPALSDVSLQSMQRADVAGKKAIQFTIVANVRAAGGNG